MQIADKYAPQQIESKWYDYWIDRGIFHSEPDEREPYTIVIPPPNVTGMLHMGHVLNNTLQDVLVRPCPGKTPAEFRAWPMLRSPRRPKSCRCCAKRGSKKPR